MKKTKQQPRKTEVDLASLPQKPAKRKSTPCNCGQCPYCIGYSRWATGEIARIMDDEDE